MEKGNLFDLFELVIKYKNGATEKRIALMASNETDAENEAKSILKEEKGMIAEASIHFYKPKNCVNCERNSFCV